MNTGVLLLVMEIKKYEGESLSSWNTNSTGSIKVTGYGSKHIFDALKSLNTDVVDVLKPPKFQWSCEGLSLRTEQYFLVKAKKR